MRLRLDPQVRSLPAAAELGNLRANEHGILATRLNPLARSLVIEYDSAKISPALLEEFFGRHRTTPALPRWPSNSPKFLA